MFSSVRQKNQGERRYKQRLYLLWTLRDLLDIANGSGKLDVPDPFHQTFDKLLAFSQLYDFLNVHKEYCYNKDIPHGSCLCEICENCVLLSKGLSPKFEQPLPTNPHDLVEKFACNLEDKACAMDRCLTCCAAEINLGKRKENQNSSSNDDSCESTDESNYDDEVSDFTWKKVEQRITKARLTVSFDDAVETFKDQIKILKEHIFIK